MKIHSDVLQMRDLTRAQMPAGVRLVDWPVERGSRSRARAFDFSLTGSSPYRANFGGDHQAATWDEWGIYLAYLFEIDPNAHCGKNSYQSEAHFHWVTGNRFRELEHADQHKQHRWGLGQSSCTGTYSVSLCVCGAVQRWMLGQHKWSELVEV